MTIVAGEVERSVASDVLRVDLCTVLKKNHHNLREREREREVTLYSEKF